MNGSTMGDRLPIPEHSGFLPPPEEPVCNELYQASSDTLSRDMHFFNWGSDKPGTNINNDLGKLPLELQLIWNMVCRETVESTKLYFREEFFKGAAENSITEYWAHQLENVPSYLMQLKEFREELLSTRKRHGIDLMSLAAKHLKKEKEKAQDRATFMSKCVTQQTRQKMGAQQATDVLRLVGMDLDILLTKTEEETFQYLNERRHKLLEGPAANSHIMDPATFKARQAQSSGNTTTNTLSNQTFDGRQERGGNTRGGNDWPATNSNFMDPIQPKARQAQSSGNSNAKIPSKSTSTGGKGRKRKRTGGSNWLDYSSDLVEPTQSKARKVQFSGNSDGISSKSTSTGRRGKKKDMKKGRNKYKYSATKSYMMDPAQSKARQVQSSGNCAAITLYNPTSPEGKGMKKLTDEGGSEWSAIDSDDINLPQKNPGQVQPSGNPTTNISPNSTSTVGKGKKNYNTRKGGNKKEIIIMDPAQSKARQAKDCSAITLSNSTSPGGKGKKKNSNEGGRECPTINSDIMNLTQTYSRQVQPSDNSTTNISPNSTSTGGKGKKNYNTRKGGNKCPTTNSYIIDPAPSGKWKNFRCVRYTD